MAGLVGLVGVGWSYGRYLPVWGDTPCERDRALCDAAANVAAQRRLAWWYAGCALLLVLGLLATLAVRALAPRTGVTARAGGRPAADDGAVAGSTRLAVSTAARAAAVAVGVLVAAPFWLFGGIAVVLALGGAAVVVLAWLVDLRLRASGRTGDLGALLVAGLAAVAAVSVSTTVVAATVHWSSRGRPGGDSWGWLVAGLVLGAAAGSAAVVAALVRLDPRGQRAAATAIWAVVVLAVLVSAASPPGREALDRVRRDLYPLALAEPPPARAAPEPTPQPLPPNPSPTTPRTHPVVAAARACAPGDLTLSARAWDSAMGTSAVTLALTNRSASACWVEGFATVAIAQAGRDLGVDVGRSTTTAYGTTSPVTRVGLPARGGEALAALWWKGYRAQADSTSPQVVAVTLRGATTPLRLTLDGTTPRIDVIEGAAMTLAPWQYPPSG
ncbi:hypothetical protein GCM10027517_16770 [Phycicoccus ginsengisoli]